ncbi:unnamed protein product, partial [Prorocentrum cordatum]
AARRYDSHSGVAVDCVFDVLIARMGEDVQNGRATQIEVERCMDEVCSTEGTFDFAFAVVMAPSS